MSEAGRSAATEKTTRRSFLRGSTALMAALAAAVTIPAPAGAQQSGGGSQEPARKPDQDSGEPPKKPDQESGEPADPSRKTLIDQDGREYRICPQCGANMYRQDRIWTCESCGYSYEE